MNSRTYIRAAALIAGLCTAGAAQLALAQETQVDADIEVTVQATTTRPRPPLRPLGRPEPLIELRENAQQRIMELREGIKDGRMDVRVELRNASSGEERREIIREVRERASGTRARITEIRGNVKERMQALVRTHVGAVIRRSENALNMFDNLVSRMESRIAKLKAAGTVTTEVEASLSASVALIATAEADLKALEDLVASVSESSDPETLKTEIRTAIEKLTASVKSAHASLLATARALAQLSIGASASAEVSN